MVILRVALQALHGLKHSDYMRHFSKSYCRLSNKTLFDVHSSIREKGTFLSHNIN